MENEDLKKLGAGILLGVLATFVLWRFGCPEGREWAKRCKERCQNGDEQGCC